MTNEDEGNEARNGRTAYNSTPASLPSRTSVRQCSRQARISLRNFVSAMVRDTHRISASSCSGTNKLDKRLRMVSKDAPAAPS